jgi:hypothetical protein
MVGGIIILVAERTDSFRLKPMTFPAFGSPQAAVERGTRRRASPSAGRRPSRAWRQAVRPCQRRMLYTWRRRSIPRLASISKRSSPLGMIAGPTGPSPRRGHSHRAPRPLERRICPSPIGGLRGHTGQSVDARRTFGLSWIKTNCLKWN